MTSSAPAYEPELWNDTTTPEQRATFLKTHHSAIVNIIGVADRSKIPVDATDRFRHESQIQQNPDYRTLQAVTAFAEADEKFKGDDQKLADHFGLKKSEITALRGPMQIMEKAFGYQEYSNCYTYAMNDRDGLRSKHKVMGGDDVGTRLSTDPRSDESNWKKIEAMNARDYEGYRKAVMEGVIADGASYGGPDAQPKDGHYRVAVYTKKFPEAGRASSDPAFDNHYVRENQDGGWSHKFGAEPVTDTDKDGKPITDPKTANINGYDFLGYVYVPEGGLDVGRKGEPASKPGSIELEKRQSAGLFPDLQMMAEQITISQADAAKIQPQAASETELGRQEPASQPKIAIPSAFRI